MNLLTRLSLTSLNLSPSSSDSVSSRPEMDLEKTRPTDHRPLVKQSSTSSVFAATASVRGGSPVAPAQTAPPSRRRRVSLDDEILRRNRRILDGYLRKLGPHLAAWQGNTAPVRTLELNSDGVCYFPYRKFVIVFDLPEDDPSCCFLYTMVCRIDYQHERAMALMKHALQLNYLQNGTRRATVGLNDDEISLCRTFSIVGTSAQEVQHILEDFLATAVEIHQQLEAIKQQPLRGILSSQTRYPGRDSPPASPSRRYDAHTTRSKRANSYPR
jgi:Tir chaperone protein (CesT) family